jgi:acyl carrier protein
MEANLAGAEMRPESTEVHGYVRELIAKVLSVPPSKIDEAELLSNYGVNSVDLIDVVVGLESKYGIRFDPKAMKNLTCRSLSENVRASLRRKVDPCEPPLP